MFQPHVHMLGTALTARKKCFRHGVVTCSERCVSVCVCRVRFQALSKLAPHIQQVSMESNGKGVDINGDRLEYEAGEVDFGEPGTNGQHSFYQLIHQGRVVPCDFIGIVRSQQSVYLKGEIVSNHDELMSNFFAQVRGCGCTLGLCGHRAM